MAAYRDLSDYSYSETDESMLNIGWLGPEVPLDTGEVPEEIVTNLTRLAVRPRRVQRGLHDCEFCDEESPTRMRVGEGAHAALGTGEIQVRGADGTVFAAPTLVIHYITAHRYCPPAAFQEAVLLTEQ